MKTTTLNPRSSRRKEALTVPPVAHHGLKFERGTWETAAINNYSVQNPSRPSRPLRDPFPRSARFDLIKQIVASHFNVSAEAFVLTRRPQEIVGPKYISIGIANEILNPPHRELARYYGMGRSAITKALQALQDRCETEPLTAATYQYLLGICQKAAGYPNDQLT